LDSFHFPIILFFVVCNWPLEVAVAGGSSKENHSHKFARRGLVQSRT